MGLLAYADLLRGDPGAAAARSEQALGAADPPPPEAAYTLQAVHGAALADQGRRAAGLAEMRAARAEFGERPVPPPVVAGLAVLEHRVALLTGNRGPARRSREWLGDRVGRTGRGAAAAGLDRGRRGPVRGGAGPRRAGAPAGTPSLLLPHTVVEAHLVGAEAALQAGDRPRAAVRWRRRWRRRSPAAWSGPSPSRGPAPRS